MTSTEDIDQDSEAVSSCQKESKDDLSHSFEVVLKDLPEVLFYIKRLNEHIKRQQNTLLKLYEKLKEYKKHSCDPAKRDVAIRDASTQTDDVKELPSLPCVLSKSRESNDQCLEWTASTGVETGLSLADEVKQIAENAMQQTGFVYEETSGMYYDYNTGYYYNAEMGLYYDGNSGTYLFYNEGTKTYQYHSHATVPQTTMIAERVETTVPRNTITADQIATALRLTSVKADRVGTVTPTPILVKAVQPVMAEPQNSPDPMDIEDEEIDDLHIPGSNPMAPVLSESSNVSLEKKSVKKEAVKKESRHDHKKKGKHKKHKSKKKKKKRHRSLSKSENSMEEGECSDSSGSQAERENDQVPIEKKSAKKRKELDLPIIEDSRVSEPIDEQPACTPTSQLWKKQRRFSDEASEAWPPCMRIIVQSTEVKNLKVGTLFIVTCKGGTLGREKSHAVTIPDINISKHHGKFTFEETSGGKYYLIDYGSRNGTYVNKQRLSSAKQESEPCEILHGTIITLGSTNLLCHIHPGRETCEECEPGVVAAKKAEEFEQSHPTNHKESKSANRLLELRRLRKRFGLEGSESKADLLAPGYEDRAEIRRVTIGSHNEHAKTETASATESIRSTNKGFKMLSKMGWKEGESLGRDGTGLTEPVLVSQRADKAGLGADNSFVPTAPSSAAASGAAGAAGAALDKWTRARQRYGQLPDTREEDQDGQEGANDND